MAKRVVVHTFGDEDVLEVVEEPIPEPGPGQVRVRLTSIGMNHAELMARRGQYKLTSGETPFTPGLEGGGIIDAVGEGVAERQVGQRVILSVDVPRNPPGHGTYRTHFVCRARQAIPAPEAIPDEQLGAIWLPYMTAWGCLVWKQRLRPGQIVGLPAASSSVALAAAQIVKRQGGVTIGLTTSPEKVDALKNLEIARYDHLIVTRRDDPKGWYRQIKEITDGKGVDVFFDPVGAGEYLSTEIRALTNHGTVWIYGLLGGVGPVDVSPLIRKVAAVRGWLMEAATADADVGEAGYRHILEGFAEGMYRQHVARTFRLDDVREAHAEMARGRHVGKLVLIP